MNKGGAVEAAFAPKGNTQLIPNSYQMSRGSLSLASALVPKTQAANGASFGDDLFDTVGATATLVVGQTYTALQLWKMLLGVDPGDQLTFPQIYGEGEAQTLTGAGGTLLDVTRFTDFVAPRLVFKSAVSDDEGITISAETTAQQVRQEMVKAIDADNSWYDPENIVDNIGWNPEAAADNLTIGENYDTVFAINNDDPLRAIGCIRSHKNVSTGKWEYSTSNLVCVWADENRGGGATSPYFGFTLINAAETYKANVVTDADGNFLQRGTDSNIVPESFT